MVTVLTCACRQGYVLSIRILLIPPDGTRRHRVSVFFFLGLTKMKKARSILPPPNPMEKVIHAVAQEVCVSEFKYGFLKLDE